jgi:hypothetical protein
MGKSLAFAFLFAVLLCGLVSAIGIIKPVSQGAIKDGETYDMGKMGPGQAMSILIQRTETTGGKYGTGGYYDFANVSGLPDGWTARPSKIYEDPLQVMIISGANATEGRYTMPITIYDENNGEGLGNITFTAAISIDNDVLALEKVSGTSYAGENQPVRFTMRASNKGNAGDIFVIEGASHRQKTTREVYIAPGTGVVVPFEFAYSGSGTEQVNFTAYSKNSPERVKKELSYNVEIKNTLESDLKAIGYGVTVFPLFEQGSYSLAHLISTLIFG